MSAREEMDWTSPEGSDPVTHDEFISVRTVASAIAIVVFSHVLPIGVVIYKALRP